MHRADQRPEMKGIVVEPNDQLITPAELANRLGVSERSVREKCYRRLWRHTRLDARTIRFAPSDVSEILAQARTRASSEPIEA